MSLKKCDRVAYLTAIGLEHSLLP